MSRGWNFRTNFSFSLAGGILLALLVPGDPSRPGEPSWPGQTVHAAQTAQKPAALGQKNAGVTANLAAQCIPPVLLSAGHRNLCRVHVGDRLPAIELSRLGGDVTDLADLQGKRATIVLFWHPDRWMAQEALRDFSAHVRQWAGESVAWVGIACGQPAEAAQAQLAAVQANFPQLLDQDDHAFSLVSTSVGTTSLPRIYVLDAAGKIVWFDIEYSEATRRELRQTIDFLLKSP